MDCLLRKHALLSWREQGVSQGLWRDLECTLLRLPERLLDGNRSDVADAVVLPEVEHRLLERDLILKLVVEQGGGRWHAHNGNLGSYQQQITDLVTDLVKGLLWPWLLILLNLLYTLKR